MKNISSNHFLKLAASFLVFVYAAHCMADKGGWHLIDNVDLIFHEAGHTLFSLFGQTMYVAGGSILQILIPLLLVAYFFRAEQLYSASVMLYWAAVSTANVAVYAGDALVMKLQLITGDPESHDWNYLLWHFGMLRHTKTIAGLIFGLAIVFLCAGLLVAAYATYKHMTEPEPEITA